MQQNRLNHSVASRRTVSFQLKTSTEQIAIPKRSASFVCHEKNTKKAELFATQIQAKFTARRKSYLDDLQFIEQARQAQQDKHDE